ncbi:MAG: RNA-binding protein [Leptolyngbyaceae cyanobacterium SM1_1_3]|nr:RNA-binding protein [Leptolyngbyaceae cyanobacterium SM1_1_3]NJN03039.1 RNA-binding protein [Leptolyngbyaceae cyanobacterium RM1_1_2]
MTKLTSKVGIEWLQTLLSLSGQAIAVQEETVTDEAGISYWLVMEEAALSAEQIEQLIGPQGEVLDSIQYLANTTLNLGVPQSEQQAYTVELAGYRARRQDELRAIAAEAVEQVQAAQQEYEVASLSSAERRQMHNFLKVYEGLETFSRGKEPDRRLVVRPVTTENTENTDNTENT